MNDAPRILVVDDEPNIRFVLAELLRREGYETEQCEDGVAALQKVRDEPWDMVIMDLRMPRMDGMTALKKMRETRPELLVLMISAHGSEKTAIEAIENGAYDFFSKPFDLNETRVVIRRALEKIRLAHTVVELRRETKSRYSFADIVGQSASMQEVYKLLERVMDNDVSVLITGESGTGKELIAAAIHENSPRKSGPFIKVNTAAIPETLLESELFGHERGAFTGAVAQKIGRFEAAHGGTIFLDEIGEMPFSLQAKLLRVLQEREIERVGSTKSIKVDIRVVCATNRDLARCVRDGTFREDLYYRINVLPIHLPPIRERRDDIPLLVDHFVGYYNPRLGKQIRGVSQAALRSLMAYPWPGNVRELENIVQRTMLMAKGSTIEADDLPPVVSGADAAGEKPPATTGKAPTPLPGLPLDDLDLATLLDVERSDLPLQERLAKITDRLEEFLIRAALAKTGGHRQETADLLGISRKSLHNKMVRYRMFGEEEKRSPDE